MSEKNVLQWDEKYSVGVRIIDDQHKQLFETINSLIQILDNNPSKQQLDEIIQKLLVYKKNHFITEEKLFEQFNYELKDEHHARHMEFNTKLNSMLAECGEDSMLLAFKLVDFLEDWLIEHLMTEDQKYVECFRQHGVK